MLLSGLNPKYLQKKADESRKNNCGCPEPEPEPEVQCCNNGISISTILFFALIFLILFNNN